MNAMVGPRITTLMMCDFAQVREGLLFVSSGDISRVLANQFPAHLRVHLAAVVHLPPDTVAEPHRLNVKFKYPDTAEMIANIDVDIRLDQVQGVYPGEGVNLPQVIDVSMIPFPHPGQVDLQVTVDETMAGDLSVWLLDGRS
jgi:hypothetical protein